MEDAGRDPQRWPQYGAACAVAGTRRAGTRSASTATTRRQGGLHTPPTRSGPRRLTPGRRRCRRPARLRRDRAGRPRRAGRLARVVRELVVLGTASQVPTRTRNHNGYLLRWDGEGVLFDPGEGTQRQMTFADVSAVVRHPGLPHARPRRPLPGPARRGAADGPGRRPPAAAGALPGRRREASVEALLASSAPRRAARGRATRPSCAAWSPRGRGGRSPPSRSTTASRPSATGCRRPTACGCCPTGSRRPACAGPDVGRLQREGPLRLGGRTVRLEEVSEPRPGQSVAVVMDTGRCDGALALARGVDLLVCESTFLHADADLAERYGHLTAPAGRRARGRGGGAPARPHPLLAALRRRRRAVRARGPRGARRRGRRRGRHAGRRAPPPSRLRSAARAVPAAAPPGRRRPRRPAAGPGRRPATTSRGPTASPPPSRSTRGTAPPCSGPTDDVTASACTVSRLTSSTTSVAVSAQAVTTRAVTTARPWRTGVGARRGEQGVGTRPVSPVRPRRPRPGARARRSLARVSARGELSPVPDRPRRRRRLRRRGRRLGGRPPRRAGVAAHRRPRARSPGRGCRRTARRAAFTSRRDGAPEVHVADLDGGGARRLTWWGDEVCRVLGWLDDDHVVAATPAGQATRWSTWAYAVPVDGGPARRLPLGPVSGWAAGPGGALALTTDGNRRGAAAWKRYRGGTIGRLWLDPATASGRFERFLADARRPARGPGVGGGAARVPVRPRGLGQRLLRRRRRQRPAPAQRPRRRLRPHPDRRRHPPRPRRARRAVRHRRPRPPTRCPRRLEVDARRAPARPAAPPRSTPPRPWATSPSTAPAAPPPSRSAARCTG